MIVKGWTSVNAEIGPFAALSANSGSTVVLTTAGDAVGIHSARRASVDDIELRRDSDHDKDYACT